MFKMCQKCAITAWYGKALFCLFVRASVANQEEKNNLSVSSRSQTKIMSIQQPALWRCFVHEGGKLENRQFVAKMHQIVPNYVSNFTIFPGVIPTDPLSWRGDIKGIPSSGDTLSPDPFPAPRGICVVLVTYLFSLKIPWAAISNYSVRSPVWSDLHPVDLSVAEEFLRVISRTVVNLSAAPALFTGQKTRPRASKRCRSTPRHRLHTSWRMMLNLVMLRR